MTELQLKLIMAIAMWCGSPGYTYSTYDVNKCREKLTACLVKASSNGVDANIQCFRGQKL